MQPGSLQKDLAVKSFHHHPGNIIINPLWPLHRSNPQQEHAVCSQLPGCKQAQPMATALRPEKSRIGLGSQKQQQRFTIYTAIGILCVALQFVDCLSGLSGRSIPKHDLLTWAAPSAICSLYLKPIWSCPRSVTVCPIESCVVAWEMTSLSRIWQPQDGCYSMDEA